MLSIEYKCKHPIRTKHFQDDKVNLRRFSINPKYINCSEAIDISLQIFYTLPYSNILQEQGLTNLQSAL